MIYPRFFLLCILVSLLAFCKKKGEVKIGSQVWMTQNLNAVTFRNGDSIQEVKSIEAWTQALHANKPAWAYYNFDEANGIYFGKLYNWYAVSDARAIAPEGWRVANTADWDRLIETMRSKGSIQGLKIDQFWSDKLGHNETGFSAYPSGCLFDEVGFEGAGYKAYWWSSDGSNNFDNFVFCIWQTQDELFGGQTSNTPGYAIRCIRNND